MTARGDATVPRGPSLGGALAAIGLWLGLLLALPACQGAPGREAELVVGTSGDYAPFSVRGASPGFDPGGFGPELLRAYAADRGIAIRFVPFRWPALLDDLGAGRFAVAVGGITIRPERGLVGRFTVPVATSGAVVLVPVQHAATAVADLDRPTVRLAVNRGGHLERVTRAHFANAHIEAIPDNAKVLPALVAGRVDAVVTDTLEAPHWLGAGPDLRVLGPFTRDRKALLVAADRAALARDLDRWLLASEASGQLERLRARYLGGTGPAPRTATPLAALLAAIDERLALMPAVAEAKRRSGAPVDVPDREARVLDAAVASVRDAAARPDDATAPVDARREAALRALFRAQIEAAKSIQRTTLASPPARGATPAPDLDGVLRPALIRIGDRIARLVVALPPGLEPEAVREATRRALGARGLDAIHIDALADAVAALSTMAPNPATRPAPADPPASGSPREPSTAAQ